MKKETKQGLAVIGTMAAVAGGIIAVTKVKAAPPLPYSCPYCEERFATLAELQAHVAAVHPGERIPIDIDWD